MPGPFSAWRGHSRAALLRLVGRLFGSVMFRWACFAVMIWLALHGEARPAPRVPDLLIDRIPYVGWIDGHNYWIWLAAYIPMGFYLMGVDPKRFIRFMVTGGILSLIRGVCILLTGLGPVKGVDVNAVRLADPAIFNQAFLELIDPFGVFFRSSAHLYLTKDLFFSGHTATTFLLLMYTWPRRHARWVVLFLHAVVVVSIFFAHLHYSIDVVGAWAITYALYTIREGRPFTAGSSPS